MILAIDPGTVESGWVLFEDGKVEASGVDQNSDIIQWIRDGGMPGYVPFPRRLAIEMIASYGMPVGAEVFETCVWIGRFVESWRHFSPPRLIYRKEVKMHLCGSMKAKDPNIRQALIDKLGAPGTKKRPGPPYGVKSHAWAALGVAVTAAEAA